jgi:hypothetical protein
MVLGLAIFAYGNPQNSATNMSNKVSNTGVVASDVAGVGTARHVLAATSYGGDKGIFGYGNDGDTGNVSMTNLVSNTGVIASDVTGVGDSKKCFSSSRIFIQCIKLLTTT